MFSSYSDGKINKITVNGNFDKRNDEADYYYFYLPYCSEVDISTTKFFEYYRKSSYLKFTLFDYEGNSVHEYNQSDFYGNDSIYLETGVYAILIPESGNTNSLKKLTRIGSYVYFDFKSYSFTLKYTSTHTEETFNLIDATYGYANPDKEANTENPEFVAGVVWTNDHIMDGEYNYRAGLNSYSIESDMNDFLYKRLYIFDDDLLRILHNSIKETIKIFDEEYEYMNARISQVHTYTNAITSYEYIMTPLDLIPNGLESMTSAAFASKLSYILGLVSISADLTETAFDSYYYHIFISNLEAYFNNRNIDINQWLANPETESESNIQEQLELYKEYVDIVHDTLKSMLQKMPADQFMYRVKSFMNECSQIVSEGDIIPIDGYAYIDIMGTYTFDTSDYCINNEAYFCLPLEEPIIFETTGFSNIYENEDKDDYGYIRLFDGHKDGTEYFSNYNEDNTLVSDSIEKDGVIYHGSFKFDQLPYNHSTESTDSSWQVFDQQSIIGFTTKENVRISESVLLNGLYSTDTNSQYGFLRINILYDDKTIPNPQLYYLTPGTHTFHYQVVDPFGNPIGDLIPFKITVEEDTSSSSGYVSGPTNPKPGPIIYLQMW